MKDRALTFALAIAAFALFYALFVHRQQAVEKPTRPLASEPGPNGYLAMHRWLESQNVPTVLLRQRFDRLASVSVTGSKAATGNLLISTAPQLLPIRNSEAQPLRHWIASGNTLLLVAGLADTPDWSVSQGIDLAIFRHLEAMTGLRFVQAPADDEAASASAVNKPSARRKRRPVAPPPAALTTPQRHELIPNGPHPLLKNVQLVAALSEFPSEQFRAEASLVNVVLELGRDRAADEPVLWLTRFGAGQIIVCGYGSVFTNKLLAQADNATLLANIVAWTVRGGRVIIDDAHQGSVEFYDASAFYQDGRLHQTIWWLIALWLCFVLGPQRLRASVSSWRPVDITAFVRATGGFLARVVKPAAAARQLFDNFFADIERLTGQASDNADWDWLLAHSAVAGADVRQLQQWHARTLQGRRVDLIQLHNLLTRVRQVLI